MKLKSFNSFKKAFHHGKSLYNLGVNPIKVACVYLGIMKKASFNLNITIKLALYI